jgi:hypothetical protein
MKIKINFKPESFYSFLNDRQFFTNGFNPNGTVTIETFVGCFILDPDEFIIL